MMGKETIIVFIVALFGIVEASTVVQPNDKIVKDFNDISISSASDHVAVSMPLTGPLDPSNEDYLKKETSPKPCFSSDGELNSYLQRLESCKAIEEGRSDKKDNALKNAPHTQSVVTADEWKHSYSRQEAAFPLYYVTQNKFWPSVARVNNTHGDRNLICTCEPVESYMAAEA